MFFLDSDWLSGFYLGPVIASSSKGLIFGAIILDYDVLLFLGSFVTFVVGKFVKFWRGRIHYSVEFVFGFKKKEEKKGKSFFTIV